MAAENSPFHVDDPSGPLRGEFAELPGSYELALRTDGAVLRPGETAELEAYLTGYGKIRNPKVSVYWPPDLLDTSKSIARFGVGPRGDGMIAFGADEGALKTVGTTIGMGGGLQVEGWEHPTVIFDVTDGVPPQVSTEQRAFRAPLSFTMVTNRSARPGRYPVSLVLTYFSGERWESRRQDTVITVQSLFQRHERVTATLGVLAALATVVTAVAALLTGSP